MSRLGRPRATVTIEDIDRALGRCLREGWPLSIKDVATDLGSDRHTIRRRVTEATGDTWAAYTARITPLSNPPAGPIDDDDDMVVIKALVMATVADEIHALAAHRHESVSTIAGRLLTAALGAEPAVHPERAA